MSQLIRLTKKQVDAWRRIRSEEVNHICEMCHRPFTKWDPAVVDHDHKSGLIRAVIHNSCNGFEGRVGKMLNHSHKGVGKIESAVMLGEYYTKFENPNSGYIYYTHKDEDEKRIARNLKAKKKRAKLKKEKENDKR